jgi:hypothetical protein
MSETRPRRILSSNTGDDRRRRSKEEEITVHTLVNNPPPNTGRAGAGQTLDQQFEKELKELEFEIGDAGGSKIKIEPTGGVPIFTSPPPNGNPNGVQDPAAGQSLTNQAIRNLLNSSQSGTITLRLCATVTVRRA